jgi:ApaG protein
MVTFDAMSRGSLCTTHGLSVQVEPRYLPQNSDPTRSSYVFAYHITIRNDSIRTATLRKRRWIIIDADGDRHVVEGDGVVGQQPTLEPGDTYEYTSFCPLETRWGTMEGAFLMEHPDGDRFEIAVARFYFVGPAPDEAAVDSSASRR